MRTFDLSVDDIDEFVCSNSSDDWHSDYVQLSPGKLKFRTRVVELPGITIFWNHFESRMRISEAYIGDKLVFGLVLRTEKPFLYRGHEFSLDHGVVQHAGADHYYIVPEHIDSLLLHVDRTLIAESGLHLCNTVERLVPSNVIDALVKECRAATRMIRRLPASQENHPLEKMLRSRILARLLDALQPWNTAQQANAVEDILQSRDYLLFRRAEQALSTAAPGAQPSGDRLADQLGVSRRRLYYAFNKWVGMGPNAYFEILRLHYVRDRLLAGNPLNTRVTDAANELGFNHLGRFAGNYYEFFGEHPSETLRRERVLKT